MKNRQGIFFAMIATSIAAMFIMTFSETRAFMLYTGAVMAIIMLLYMIACIATCKLCTVNSTRGKIRCRRSPFEHLFLTGPVLIDEPVQFF